MSLKKAAWVSTIVLLFLGLSCSGEVAVSIPGCENCPERCLLADGTNKGKCVTCLKDLHCQDATSPTKKCTQDNKCVCGTDKDCSSGKKCNGSGGCVDCLRSEDCTDSGNPACVDNKCMQCVPGSSQACLPDGGKACVKGIQQCQGGVWSECKDWKNCSDFEKCVENKCVPDCPADQCKEGEFQCTTKASEIPGQYKVCTKNTRSCYEFAADIKDCPRQNYCDQGKCVQAKCPKGQTDCNDICVNTTNDRENCGACGTQCKNGEVCGNSKCTFSCPTGQANCGGSCVDTQSDRSHCGTCANPCTSGQVCSNGTCVVSCLAGQTNCGGSCVDTQSDLAHCGGCGNACASGQVCSVGKCVISCLSSQTNCSSSCVDLKTDRSHCGACGKACPSGEICNNGACEVSCPVGQTHCTGTCADLQTDRKNCGKCGDICKDGYVCTSGKCELSCAAGQTNCGGSCVDVQSDRARCGTCGNACGNGQVCAAGKCEVSCPTGRTNCGGNCVDTQSDRAHCGKCASPCTSGHVCTVGKCEVSCQQGLSDCGGKCVDIQIDRVHCGKCGNTCPSGQVCVNAKCEVSCPSGQIDCKGFCVDIQSDRSHCGGCGNACLTGQVCSAGKCELSCQSELNNCAGKCTDLQTDNQNCGICAKKCASGQICNKGTCELSCHSVTPINCGGICVDTQTSDVNCGQCGVSCQGGKKCIAGQCICLSGTTDCLGACKDLQNDRNHCGVCNNACGSGQFCINGKCELFCQSGLSNCGNKCVDLQSDKQNCGSCGNVCSSVQFCINGTCKISSLGCANNTSRMGFIDTKKFPEIAACGPVRYYPDAIANVASTCAVGWRFCNIQDIDKYKGNRDNPQITPNFAWIQYENPTSTHLHEYSTNTVCQLPPPSQQATAVLRGSNPCTSGGSDGEGWRLGVSDSTWGKRSHDVIDLNGKRCLEHATHICGVTGGVVPGYQGYQGLTLCCKHVCQPSLEICDGLDNNCNGQIDEGIVGCVTTVAGVCTKQGYKDGPAESALFNGVSGIVKDSFGNFYISDHFNHCIRKLDTNGNVTTVAGICTQQGYKDGPAKSALFYGPHGLAIDSQNVLYIVEMVNHCIRKLDTQGNVTTVAGSCSQNGFQDGTTKTALFDHPTGIVVNSAGELYVSEFRNHRIRKIDKNGNVTTFAGTGTPSNNDGYRTQATFWHPMALVLTPAEELYVANNIKIRFIDKNGMVSTIAGNNPGGYQDGAANQALFSSLIGLVQDHTGNLYVADHWNHRIRKIDKNGIVSTAAGSGPIGTSLPASYKDGPAAQAIFRGPAYLTLDASGNLYITDHYNHCIRRLNL